MPLVTALSAAEILAEPMVSAVASPVPVVTVATAGLSELQVALLVTSWVLPSLKVAVAANCCCDPKVMSAVPGVAATDCTVTEATVSCVRLTMLPEVTVINRYPWYKCPDKAFGRSGVADDRNRVRRGIPRDL